MWPPLPIWNFASLILFSAPQELLFFIFLFFIILIYLNFYKFLLLKFEKGEGC